MRRTLMLKNQELLDFDVDVATGEIRILDAPGADDAQLMSLGLGGPDRETIVATVIQGRRLSSQRVDVDEVLEAFGASSGLELVFRGHGLSFTDKIWYRAPGSTERWEDLNFYDHDWDDTFRTAILAGDYGQLAQCSPDIPDVTTAGHLRKVWERSEGCVQLVKEPLFESGVDLEGAWLGAELCRLLFGQDAYQPLRIVERAGRRFSASPLMVGRDEELVQGMRLFAMDGYDTTKSIALMGSAPSQDLIDIFVRAGVVNASAHVAKLLVFKDLALLQDIHAGNFGIIRNIDTGACRPAPPFDYDRSFGFPSEEFSFERYCKDPKFAAFICAATFSDLDASWDWSWYDPHVLEGFEDRIIPAYAGYTDVPENFGDLVRRLFVMQRGYVNGIALA